MFARFRLDNRRNKLIILLLMALGFGMVIGSATIINAKLEYSWHVSWLFLSALLLISGCALVVVSSKIIQANEQRLHHCDNQGVL